jgi:hypothetical protein
MATEISSDNITNILAVLVSVGPWALALLFGLGAPIYIALKRNIIEYEIIVTEKEAEFGTKKILVRNNKKLELGIPPGVRSFQKIVYRNALRSTDKCKGDIHVFVALDKDVRDLGHNYSSRIKLINNPKATAPSIDNLISFCLQYDHKGRTYIPKKYVCANFAERFHNVAEIKGIRTAYVVVEFDSGELHAINLVETQSGQEKFIDTTSSYMTFVDVTMGKPYIQKAVGGLNNVYFEPLGIVKKIREIIW